MRETLQLLARGPDLVIDDFIIFPWISSHGKFANLQATDFWKSGYLAFWPGGGFLLATYRAEAADKTSDWQALVVCLSAK